MKKKNTDNVSMKQGNSSSSIIIQTDQDAKNGQNKCPNCGSTDISLDIDNECLICNYCQYKFEPKKVVGLETDLNQLHGQIIGSGVQDIKEDTNDIITLKCSSCGAEVVIDTSHVTQARCHWCRNYLSINQQIPNGSIPDAILPFSISKKAAREEIDKFVKSRKFYAHPKFKEEFTTENIVGVYFPYIVVDVNAHANFTGQGEHLVNSYISGSKDHKRTYYDADLYQVEREFDLVINGLTIESNSDRLNNSALDKTNNVINAIMPFDIENCVQYNANYLKGYTSERRDINIDTVRSLVEEQSKDIARFSINDTLKQYDRGVHWDKENLTIKGQQWKAAYLPVWLYSYQQERKKKKILHYVAVNARTKETMGSIPVHLPKLFFVSFLIEIFSIFMMLSFFDSDLNFLFFLPGFIYFFLIYTKYRNLSARHKYETETKTELSNLRKVDKFMKSRKGLTNPKITGANNQNVNGANTIMENIHIFKE